MLFVSEADVQQLLPIELAIERVEASLRAQAQNKAVNHPRRRIFLPHVSLHYMAAAIPGDNLLGLKIYTVSRQSFRFVVLLYEAEKGELLAMIEADHLGRLRTGAASGVASKALSRPESRTVGLIGAGRQARTQLEAVSRVRELKAVRVFSRDATRRSSFCQEMSARLQLEIEPAESADAAARFGDIVITATNAREPVLLGDWLKEGAHVNAIGANMPDRREVDEALLRRARVIAVDSIEQARIESGDLIRGFAQGPQGWEAVVELGQVLTGDCPGRRTANEVTLFKSAGIALWDIAAAGAVYRRALESGRGKTMDLSASTP